MAVTTYDVLVPGHYFCDIIFSGFPRFPELGTELYTENLTVVAGGVVNTVVGLQRLGVNVGWVGTLGNDFFSNYVADVLRHENVDTSLLDFPDHPLQRVTVALSLPSDRAFVTYVDVEPDILAMTFQALERNDMAFRHVHIPELRVDERLLELIDLCHARGVQLSMDCQHLDDTIENPLIQEILRKADFFSPNALEAQRLTGAETLHEAVNTLRQWVDFVVVKDGEAGAHAWRGDQYLHVKGLEMDTIVDTTGAGDVFNAGFLAAYLEQKPLGVCLKWGNVAGGLSLRGAGGCSTAPTLSELLARLPDIDAVE